MVIIITFISISLCITGCGEDSWISDLFTLKSVKTVRDENVEQLKKKASEYEKELDEKLRSADSLSIVYQKLGEKYLDGKAWTSAIEAFKKSIGYGRNTSSVHYSLAVAYANRGSGLANKDDIEKAEHHYKKALEISPDNYEASYGLGILLFYRKQERKEAVKIMENIVQRKKDFYRARFALGRFYYELNKINKSLSIYENIHYDLESKTDSPEVKKYKKESRRNIERLMLEISRKR